MAGAMFSPFRADAAKEEFVFTYDYDGATYGEVGIGRYVTIDAAMLLKDASLTGSEIVGISVDVPTKEGCACAPEASAWLTTRLMVDGEYNKVDLQEVKGEIRNHGTAENPVYRLDLTFDTPYTLTDDGVYVGYSLRVTALKNWTQLYPIRTVTDVDKTRAFMIHCTKGESTLPQKYGEWTDYGTPNRQALAMRVILRGDVYPNSAAILPEQTLYAAPGETGYVYTTLSNTGSEAISSIEYSYTLPNGDDEPRVVTKEFKVDPPLAAQAGAVTTLDLPFETPGEVGRYAVEISLDKVNGAENSHTGTSVLDMDIVPFLPKYNPLVEDYTGFACGYCPAVYVTIRQLQDKYGEDFLTMAYHVNDRLMTVPEDDFPSSSYGLPKVYMENRSQALVYQNLETLWLRNRRQLAPAEIEAELTWSDNTRSALRVDTKLKFVYDDPEAEYMLTYAMVEDDMSSSSWMQENQYFNQNIEGPYWDLFCGQPYMVQGLVYNDVVVSYPDTRGIPGSVPSDIIAGETYGHVGVLKLADATCASTVSTDYRKNVILDNKKLRVIALLIDGKTGYVRNAVSTGYSGDAQVFDPSTNGVEAPGSEAEVTATEYFTLDGIRLDRAPESGAAITVEHLSDGSVRTTKAIY